jgi:RHS repeat-associated protein
LDPVIADATDYFPFGAPNRTVSSSAGYRYGFNGKELDKSNEFGTANVYDYGFRIYNPSIGRFLSVDPLTRSYPELTPYQFASNTPLMAIDLDGLEAIFYTIKLGIKTTYAKKVRDEVPFSWYWNYSWKIDPELSVINDVEIKKASELSYKLILKVPIKASLAGNEFVPLHYDEYIYNGSSLEGASNPENWIKSTNLGQAFRDGVENGLMVGVGEGILDEVIDAAGLTLLSKIASYNPRLAASILGAEKFVKEIAIKIESAAPKLIRNIERRITKNGRTLTDFDI